MAEFQAGLIDSKGHYSSNEEHLLDELKRLDLIIGLKVASSRLRPGGEDPYKALYISDEDVCSLLDPVAGSRHQKDDPSLRALADEIALMEEQIEEKSSRSLERGIKLNLSRLAETFRLSRFERDAVLICAAFELDTRYERLYAYLQDDLTRKYPSPGLILNLLCDSPEEKVAFRKHFLSDSPLIAGRILEVPGSGEQAPSMSSILGLNEGVLKYIMDIGLSSSHHGLDLDQNLTSFGTEALLPEDMKFRINNLANRIRSSGEGAVCFLCFLNGPRGPERKQIAELICRKAGVGLISAHLGLAPLEEIESKVSSAFLDAGLRGFAVYIDGLDCPNIDEARSQRSRSAVLRGLSDFDAGAFIAGQNSFEPEDISHRSLFTLEVTVPDYQSRLQIWKKSLGDSFDEAEISDLANKFRFTPGQIRASVGAASNLAALEGREKTSLEDLYEGCRSQSGKLSSLARRIKPRYAWGDIVLPLEKIRQLKDIQGHIKHRGRVYEEWGFGKRLSLGKGLNVLFSGPSGTGKTMAAEVMASELGLDLYKVDLSAVVSKYIGETEKNLSRIFAEAEGSNAILFFDEADAIFGKRTEVRDSHDRYANVEVSYLLQKMEEHEGVVITASNLKMNIDDAFLRRMQFTVDFPFPEEGERLRIWRGMMPEAAPVAGDLDLEFLARRLKVAGGNIRNIVVNAAFLAAEGSGIITMAHLVNAAKREFQKMGKVCGRDELGKYYDHCNC